jgi:hypothetical protein
MQKKWFLYGFVALVPLRSHAARHENAGVSYPATVRIARGSARTARR